MPETPSILLLSSRRSTYGAQVFQAALRHGLRIECVVIESQPARGGWKRFRQYQRKYGLAATLFRSLEMVVSALWLRLNGVSPLPAIEAQVARNGVAVQWVPSHNHPMAHCLFQLFPDSLALVGGTRILSPRTLACFTRGVFNAHPGWLPEYRGNYPNRWALLHGRNGGISVYRLDAGLDTGPVLDRCAVDRQPGEGILSYERRVTALCAEFLIKTVQEYLECRLVPQPQDLSLGKTYGLMPVRDVFRLYRQLNR